MDKLCMSRASRTSVVGHHIWTEVHKHRFTAGRNLLQGGRNSNHVSLSLQSGFLLSLQT